MIQNKEKLEGCTSEIKKIAEYLEGTYGTIKINSGYRSTEYNIKVGGAKNSSHCKGMAIDVSVSNVSAIKIAATILNTIGFFKIKGIGLSLYSNYVHIDIKDRGIKDIVYWVYDKKNKVV